MRQSLMAAHALPWMMLSLLVSCGGSPDREHATKKQVIVSIMPQAYLVERVGGDLVEIAVLVGPGQSPETYDPTPQQMMALAEADVYFRIGVPFENSLVDRTASAFRSLVVVDTRKGITLREMEPHYHGEDVGQHSDSQSGGGTPDPHTWLDPRLAKRQAQTICGTLADLDPDNAETYRSNLESLENDLDSVHNRITTLLKPYSGFNFYVFHPAYGYFAEAYGLKQVAVEAEGKGPGTRRLAELIDMIKHSGVRTIFVQPQFSTKAAESIAKEVDGEVVPLDPLSRDYLDNLTDIAVKIRKSFPEPTRLDGDHPLRDQPAPGGADE